MKGRDSAHGECSQAIGSIRTQNNWGHKNMYVQMADAEIWCHLTSGSNLGDSQVKKKFNGMTVRQFRHL